MAYINTHNTEEMIPFIFMAAIPPMMKLRTLLDDRHNDDEIADRLKQIDADIHAMEEALKHDLDFRGLLIHL